MQGDGTPIPDVHMAGFLSPYDYMYANSIGYYLAYLSSGWSGTVTPRKTGWTFSPTNTAYSNVTSNQGRDYVGSSGSPTETWTPTITLTPTPIEFSCSSVTEIPQIECEALVDLYYSTTGPGWAGKPGWLANNAPCTSP